MSTAFGNRIEDLRGRASINPIGIAQARAHSTPRVVAMAARTVVRSKQTPAFREHYGILPVGIISNGHRNGRSRHGSHGNADIRCSALRGDFGRGAAAS